MPWRGMIAGLKIWKAGDCWGFPGWLVRHYPVADHTRSLLWKKGTQGVSLLVHQAREAEWWGRRSVPLSNDKSLVPLWGRQDHICHNSWQCCAPVPLLPQSCHPASPGRRQKLQSAEGKLRVNPLPFPRPPAPMWRGDERGGMKSCTTGKAKSSALPQPAFMGTGG